MSSSPVIGLKDVFGNISDPGHFLEFQTRARTLQLLSAPVEHALNVRLLIGEPGVGKTALLLRLLQQLESTVLTTRLFWTQLRRSEFLHYFLHELAVPRPSPNLPEAQKQLTSVLEQNFLCGRQVMVVIDEAHELNISTLRAVAELLDCPLGQSKQLRIILAGLPVLKVRTASPPLAEFSKRISVIASLGPLTFEESCSYIRQKIELSGVRDHQHFTDDAIVLIAKLAGIPADINNLCFEAVYRAEQRGYRQIDEGLVLEIAAEEGGTSARTDGQQVSSTETKIPIQGSKAQTAGFAWLGRGKEFEELGSRHGSHPVLQPAAVCSGSSDALSTCISNWFGDERLAWAGTTGELAASLQQPEAELMKILTSRPDALRDLGIQLDLVESYGHSSSVRLRALESRKKRKAETAAEAMLKTREGESPGDGKSSAPLIKSDVPESEASQQEPVDEISDGVEADAVPLSAFGNTLEASLFRQSDSLLKHHSSRLRRAAMPVLLSIVALGLALAIAYALLNRRVLSAHIPLTAAQSTAGEQRGTVASDVRTRVIANGAGNVSPITKPSPQSSSQLKQAARSGDANAQLELGTAYATGRGVPEDSVTAYTWLTLAFANGNNQAESLIRELTRRVGSAEIARIRWNLGEMYAEGIGVPQDNVTAYMWHMLAELSGETRSRVARERLARSMTADQKSEAQARASEWLRKHHQAATAAKLPPDQN
jgi:type II secretory pathway predicted ATPase ExeA/TPR repeat protein